MDNQLYKAVVKGDVHFLSDIHAQEIESGQSHEYFLSLTSQKNNIIHIAAQHGHLEFIIEALKISSASPYMISQKNATNGDTPLHVAARSGNMKIVELLIESSKNVVHDVPLSIYAGREGDCEGEDDVVESGGGDEVWQPWRVKNKEGNTPLHAALMSGKVGVARYLVEVDPQLALVLNNSGETPLHLAIKHRVDDDKKLAIDTIELVNKRRARLAYKGCPLEKESLPIIKLLLEKNIAAVNTFDSDGLTPLLRAAVKSHIPAIEAIISECPESAEARDPNGRTFLHLIKLRSYKEAMKILQIPEFLALKDEQDNMGNTPAHAAIMNILEHLPHELSNHEANVLSKASQKLESSLVEFAIGNKQVTNIDVDVVRALLECSANFTIKNKEGFSAADLIQQQPTCFSSSNVLFLENEETEANPEETNLRMVEDLDVIASPRHELDTLGHSIEGGRNLLHGLLGARCNTNLKENDDKVTSLIKLIREVLKLDKLRSKVLSYSLQWGGNLLHGLLGASCHTNLEENDDKEASLKKLIREVVERFPVLICQTDSRGDTPLHIMVRDPNISNSKSLLDHVDQYYHEAQGQVAQVHEELYCPPWKVKNMEGNTPLHEALLHVSNKGDGLNTVRALIKLDHEVAGFLNNRNETPLHVLCGLQVEKEYPDYAAVAKELIIAKRSTTCMRDVDGLTPLLKAATRGKIQVVTHICDICPQSADLRDSKERTFLHLLKLEDSAGGENLFRNPKIKSLMFEEDRAGNSPLHLAIHERNFELAQVLSKHSLQSKQFDEICKEDDSMMIYVPYLLTFADRLPKSFEKTLWAIVKTLGVKSILGVQEQDIDKYINVMGFIAPLLATISFQAAISVPGGFEDGEKVKGVPVLLEKNYQLFLTRAAFWVFMMTDILTLCLSMMVIYCLLWIMTAKPRERLVLTDFSICLLQACFTTTMVAFMMGIFALTFQVDPKLAIVTCVVCSLVMVLFQKCIITGPLVYLFLFVTLLWQLVLWLLRRVWSYCCDMVPIDIKQVILQLRRVQLLPSIMPRILLASFWNCVS